MDHPGINKYMMINRLNLLLKNTPAMLIQLILINNISQEELAKEKSKQIKRTIKCDLDFTVYLK